MIQYINCLFFKIPPLQKNTFNERFWVPDQNCPQVSQKYKFTAVLLIRLFLKRKKD